MTNDEQENEIAAMVMERNQLRRSLACLDNKLDRIGKALIDVHSAIRNRKRLRSVVGEGIIGSDGGPVLPSPAEILEAQNQRLDAKARIEELDRRIDCV